MKLLLIALCIAAPFGVLGMEEVDSIEKDKERFVAAYKADKLYEAIDDYQKGYDISDNHTILQSFARSIEKEVLASAHEICDEQTVATFDELDETIALVVVLIQASDDGFPDGRCICTTLKSMKNQAIKELKLAEQEKHAEQKQHDIQDIIAAFKEGKAKAVRSFVMNYRQNLSQSSDLPKKVKKAEIKRLYNEIIGDVLDTTEGILEDPVYFTTDEIEANLALLTFIRLTYGSKSKKIQSWQRTVHYVLQERKKLEEYDTDTMFFFS